MPVYPIKIVLQIAAVCHLMIYGCFCLFVVALLLLLDYYCFLNVVVVVVFWGGNSNFHVLVIKTEAGKNSNLYSVMIPLLMVWFKTKCLKTSKWLFNRSWSEENWKYKWEVEIQVETKWEVEIHTGSVQQQH